MPLTDGRQGIAALTDGQIAALFAVALPARHLPPGQLTAEQIAALVVARRVAAVRFRWFIAYVSADDLAPYSFDTFHLELIAELQLSFEGAAPRMLISAPPRHGKSRLCAILYPCFVAGNDPRSFVIIASYSQELAREHLREARSVLLSSAFREIFPLCELDPDAMSADLLRTASGGYLRGVGAGGTLTGLSATHLILDDLVKSYDEAASELVRASTSQWYRTAARTRLSPNGKIVAIGTRWHHMDILGEIIAASENGSGEHWEHVTFPAIDGQGNALWPQRYPVSALNDLRATLGSMQFQALFQGSPTPAGGGFFRADWFRYCQPDFLGPERDLLTCIVSDFALSEGAGDWSVIMVVSINPEGNIFLRHVWRERVTMDATLSALLSICAKWKPSAWSYENDAIMQSALPLIRQRLMQHKVNLWHIQHSRQASKVQKAGALQGILEQRGIYLPADAPWADALIAEAITFPAGATFDQIDALAHLGRAWLKLRPKAVTPEPKPKVEGMCLDELWSTGRRGTTRV